MKGSSKGVSKRRHERERDRCVGGRKMVDGAWLMRCRLSCRGTMVPSTRWSLESSLLGTLARSWRV